MQEEFSTLNGVPQIIRAMAKVSGDEILPHFRKQIDVENKLASTLNSNDSAFDPVTIADKNAEAALRKFINEKFPEHGILGEEYGGENLDAEYVWVLDPIDGTRAFVSGLPLWGTLIALCHEGRPVLGAMIQPFLNEIYVGGGNHSWLAAISDDTMLKPLKTSQTTQLSKTTIFTTEPALFQNEERERYETLEKSCQLHRYCTDCYGYAMVAAGFGDLTVEAGFQIYDIAALVPLIQAAGGVVTNWQGMPIEGLIHTDRLQVLASANTKIHLDALNIINARHQFRG